MARTKDPDSSTRTEDMGFRCQPLDLMRLDRLASLYFAGRRAPTVEFIVSTLNTDKASKGTTFVPVLGPDDLTRTAHVLKYIEDLTVLHKTVNSRLETLVDRGGRFNLPEALVELVVRYGHEVPKYQAQELSSLSMPSDLLPAAPLDPPPADKRKRIHYRLKLTPEMFIIFKSTIALLGETSFYTLFMTGLDLFERILSLEELDAPAAIPRTIPPRDVVNATRYLAHHIHALMTAWSRMPVFAPAPVGFDALLGELQAMAALLAEYGFERLKPKGYDNPLGTTSG